MHVHILVIIIWRLFDVSSILDKVLFNSNWNSTR